MLVHALAPPTRGGTPIVLHRLLTHLPDVRLEVVTRSALRDEVRNGGARVLPARYRFVAKWPGPGRRWLPGRIATAAVDLVLAGVAGLRAGRWARRDGAHWILSVVDEGFSVIAGAIAARRAGLPHLILVCDLWEENSYSEVDRWIARRLERTLWRRAAAIIGFDDQIAEHYGAKHGVRTRVIPTPIDPPEAASDADGRHAAQRGAEVIYAGALYWAQEEAARRLARVCEELPDVRLTVIGDAAQAAAVGLKADAVEAPLAPERFRARVAEADVAAVCLSFRSPHPEVIATAAPARLPEYMASGTPILVHAPAGSHVAEYARREDFAELVDQADDDALAAGIRRVVADSAQRTRRARRARELALERHAARPVALRLREILAELDPEAEAPA
jgi:glycosyltransferase involved in cell wall biosynthesis